MVLKVVSSTGGGGGISSITVGSTPTSGGAAGQVLFDTGTVVSESANLVWDVTNTALNATGYALKSGGIISETTTARTLSAGDNGKVIYTSNSSATTVTTASGLGAGFSCVIIQGGTGAVNVAAGANTTVSSYGSFVNAAGQYAAMTLICPSANAFVLLGQIA